MTEHDWLTSTDPGEMLRGLELPDELPQGPSRMPSDRKLRLFAVACCRAIWRHLKDKRSRKAVLAGEHYADGRIVDLCSIWNAATNVNEDGSSYGSFAETHAAEAAAACAIERFDGGRGFLGHCLHAGLVFPSQANLLREIVGNPCRPLVRERDYLRNAVSHAVVEAAAHAIWEASGLRGRTGDEVYRRAVDGMVFCESWLTPLVCTMAQTAYDSRDFGSLPILADALEDAGCDNVDVLTHLRGPGPHVRGCWVLDLLTGRE